MHLVYSARDLARQIPAEWQEGIKHRASRLRRLPDPGAGRAAQQADHVVLAGAEPADVLTRWSKGLPPEPSTSSPSRSPVPRATCSGSATARRSASTRVGARQSDRENVSLGAAETALRPQAQPTAEAGRADVRGVPPPGPPGLVVHQTLAQRPRMAVTLPPAAFPWAEEIAQEWIEWVEGSGIDVSATSPTCGPVRPKDDALRGPTRTGRAAAMVDAALDALVALAVEASAPARAPTTRSPRGSGGPPGGCGASDPPGPTAPSPPPGPGPSTSAPADDPVVGVGRDGPVGPEPTSPCRAAAGARGRPARAGATPRVNHVHGPPPRPAFAGWPTSPCAARPPAADPRASRCPGRPRAPRPRVGAAGPILPPSPPTSARIGVGPLAELLAPRPRRCQARCWRSGPPSRAAQAFHLAGRRHAVHRAPRAAAAASHAGARSPGRAPRGAALDVALAQVWASRVQRGPRPG